MTTKMKCGTIKKLEGYDRFKKVCQFIVLEEEYPGWTGDEEFGIITGEEEGNLLKEFPMVMKALRPYIILDMNYGEVRKESLNNDRRHTRHRKETESLFDVDDELENHHGETARPDFAGLVDDRIALEAAFTCLTKVQESRVRKHFYMDMNYKQIAASEGSTVNSVSVYLSIQRALKKMKIYLL